MSGKGGPDLKKFMDKKVMRACSSLPLYVMHGSGRTAGGAHLPACWQRLFQRRDAACSARGNPRTAGRVARRVNGGNSRGRRAH